MIALGAVVALAVAAGGAAAVYNGLVVRRNAFGNAFGQIGVQLARRHDLVPNLVATAKGYLAHERATLEAVVAARGGAVAAARGARPGDAAAMRRVGEAEAALSGALSRLVAVAESYPQLRADATMARLMEELASTENRIAFARQAFNDAVLDYDNSRETFPGLVFAGRFPRAEPLATSAEAAAPVRVAF